MIRIMIHSTVNVRGFLMEQLKLQLPTFEKNVGDKIKLVTPHDPEYDNGCTEEWIPQAIENNILPDFILINSPELADHANKMNTCGLFSDIMGECYKEHPVREELKMLSDSNGIIYPSLVTPLAMFYNKENVSENKLVHSWKDLLNPELRVLLPDRDKPLTRVIGGYLKKTYPDEFEKFEKRIVYDGTPNSVVKSVASGEYDISMTLAAFAFAAPAKKISVNITNEGFYPMPQVILMKKGANKKLKCITDLLLSDEVQKYLSEQNAWVSNPNVPLCETFQHSGMLSEWKGWDELFNMVDEFDNYERE